MSANDQILLIRQLLRGSCGDDDERAIIRIVKEGGQARAIAQLISQDEFDSGVDGAEWDELFTYMRQQGIW